MDSRRVTKILFPITHGVQAFDLNKEIVREFGFKVKEALPIELRVRFRPFVIDWDDILGGRQMEAFRTMAAGRKRQRLLKLKHTVGSDLAWLFPGKHSESGFSFLYERVFDKIKREIDSRYRSAGEDAKIVHCGHSLGGQLALRYCWDSTYPVDGLITMGAPIDMFSGAFLGWGKKPPLREFWLNVNMKWDWIGSEMGLHPNPDIRDLAEDLIVNPWWNPLRMTTLGAHTAYWTDKRVIRGIAKRINDAFGT